ncbi:MFS transporter [Labrys okinawensis]|uniref:MFS transporter n=1 Tax=Labrys okinawensis TaxID=346911 RepID=A0A2S9QGT3_9HYPH|nr:MFS transporter [Labrys okinawensis]PRH88559.1 MFS transporter [Labrys okinawensis]
MTPDSRRLRFVYFLVAGSGLVNVARAMSLSFLAVKLQQSFGLGPAAIGVLLGTGPLLGAIAAPVAGSLSDRVGRQFMLVLMLVLTALSLIGMGFAQSVTAFCAAQIVAAISIAVYEPISRALMSDICPPELRLKYFSWRYMAVNAGWAVGPLIGVAAGTAFSLLFTLAGCIYAAFAFALHLVGVPAEPKAAGSEATEERVSIIASIRAAIRDPRLTFFVGGGTLLIAVYGQWSATLAPYLSATLEGGVDLFAYLLSINGMVVLAGNLFARRLIEKVGALHAMVLGCVLILASELGFLASTGFSGFALFMVLFTIGEILVVPSEYLLVDGICNARNRGSYFGAHSFSTIGNFFGPAIGGVMLGAFGGAGMFLTFAAFAAASAVMFTIGTRMPPPRPRAEGAVAATVIEISGLSSRLRHA